MHRMQSNAKQRQLLRLIRTSKDSSQTVRHNRLRSLRPFRESTGTKASQEQVLHINHRGSLNELHVVHIIAQFQIQTSQHCIRMLCTQYRNTTQSLGHRQRKPICEKSRIRSDIDELGNSTQFVASLQSSKRWLLRSSASFSRAIYSNHTSQIPPG